MHAPTAPIDSAAPRLRLRRAGVVSQLDTRTGRSTRTKVAVATAKLSAATPRFWPSDSACPTAAGTRMRSGQCQRYHEYDTRPTTCMGDVRSTRTGPRPRSGAPPAAMIAAAPSTGTKAAVPGNGVEAVKKRTDYKIMPRPSQPSSGAPLLRATTGAPRAMSPPTANSQARVGSEKKAQGSDAWVSQMENAHDDTAMTPSTAAAVA